MDTCRVRFLVLAFIPTTKHLNNRFLGRYIILAPGFTGFNPWSLRSMIPSCGEAAHHAGNM